MPEDRGKKLKSLAERDKFLGAKEMFESLNGEDCKEGHHNYVISQAGWHGGLIQDARFKIIISSEKLKRG